MEIMTAYDKELYIWKQNHEWYGITSNGEFYLKDNAPKEAKESFEKFKKYHEDKLKYY